MKEVKEKVNKKLNDLYANDKSKNFVLHLVRAYLPLDKPKKVFVEPEKKGAFKCALTGQRLISIDEVFKILQSAEYQESFIKDLKFNAGLMGEEAKENNISKSSELKKLTKNRIVGFQGTETSTYLCQEAVEAMFKWVTNKLMENDGKIAWTVRQMNTKAFKNVKTNKKDKSFTKGKKRKNKNYNQKPIKPASQSLGEISGLQALKDKMESSENES